MHHLNFWKFGPKSWFWATNDWISFCENLILWKEGYCTALFWIIYHSLCINSGFKDMKIFCKTNAIFPFKIGLCLHKEELYTVMGGAISCILGRIRMVCDDEICPLIMRIARNIFSSKPAKDGTILHLTHFKLKILKREGPLQNEWAIPLAFKTIQKLQGMYYKWGKNSCRMNYYASCVKYWGKKPYKSLYFSCKTSL